MSHAPLWSPEAWALRPWSTGDVTPHATCVLAPNPGPMTLDGTNTWIVHEGAKAVVIDPGPHDEDHVERVAEHCERLGTRVTGVLLTHGHADHSAGARLAAERFGVGVRALDPAHVLGGEGLRADDVVAVGEIDLRVMSTPGHTADSMSFVLGADGAVLTGDTVLGRGTTVVAYPDGHLGEYLDSLHRIQDWAQRGSLHVLPGHGPAVPDPVGILEHYLEHRHARLAQVSDCVDHLPDGGDLSAHQLGQAVVERVYADVPREVWPAALLSVLAQLEYLGLV